MINDPSDATGLTKDITVQLRRSRPPASAGALAMADGRPLLVCAIATKMGKWSMDFTNGERYILLNLPQLLRLKGADLSRADLIAADLEGAGT